MNVTTRVRAIAGRRLAPLACATTLLLLLAWPILAHAAPVLRSADIRIVIHSETACDVSMRLVVDGGTAVEHRIATVDGTRIGLSAIRGARQVEEPRTVGRTRSLVLETASNEYELAYSVEYMPAYDRCPLWVPVAPADGVSRAVRISVQLPLGMSSRGTLPALTWNGSMGTTTLGHVPAFVRVPRAAAGASMTWDVSTAMDALTLVVFAGASGIWIWRRRR